MKWEGDVAVYPEKIGAEAAQEWERVRGMRLSRVVATMVLCRWPLSGGWRMRMTRQKGKKGKLEG